MREEVKGLDYRIAIDCRDIVVDECWGRDILYDDTDVGKSKGEIDELGYIAVITNSRNDDDAFQGTRQWGHGRHRLVDVQVDGPSTRRYCLLDVPYRFLEKVQGRRLRGANYCCYQKCRARSSASYRQY